MEITENLDILQVGKIKKILLIPMIYLLKFSKSQNKNKFLLEMQLCKLMTPQLDMKFVKNYGFQDQ